MSDDGINVDLSGPDKVISIAEHKAKREAIAKDPPVRTQLPVKMCFHRDHTVYVDSNKRTLTCGGCETVLDPIEVVERWAHEGDQLDSMYRELKRVRVEKSDVEDAIKRARGRLQRAEKKLPSAELPTGWRVEKSSGLVGGGIRAFVDRRTGGKWGWSISRNAMNRLGGGTCNTRELAVAAAQAAADKLNRSRK